MSTEPRTPLRSNRAVPFALLVVLLVILGYGLAHYALNQSIGSQRAGCERGQLIKVDQVNTEWADHVANLQATESKKSNPDTRQARAFEDQAEQALAIAESKQIEPASATKLPIDLRRYATFSCVAAYPEPSILP